MTSGPYVAVAGPIGVGKTTLAQRLAERWGWPFVRERFDRNPFLAEFYRRGQPVALATELFFLWSRFEQLRQVPPAGEAAVGPVLTDYLFVQGLLFSALTLAPDEQATYRALYDLLADKVRPPDAVVYLTDTTDRLMKRIRHRGRAMELAIQPDYVEPLRQAYDEHFAGPPAAVLRIDCARDDPLSEPVIRRIESFVGLPSR